MELEVILRNSISKKIILLMAVFSFGNSQNFKIKNLKEITLPNNSSVERVQVSPNGKWLSLESMPGAGRFKGYIVKLDDPSNIIPIKKSFKSSRSLHVEQIKWSTTGEDIFYFISQNQMEDNKFYKFNLKEFNNKNSYIDDLGKIIFNNNHVPIQSFAINKYSNEDWFVFAKKNENKRIAISYYAGFLEEQKVYSGDITINHFNSNNKESLSFVKLDKNTKRSKIIMLRDDYDYSSTVEWKREKEVDEISPKFSKNDSGNYLAFLAKAEEEPSSEIFDLWLFNSPLDESVLSPKKIAGPIKTSRVDISFEDQNFDWHPTQSVIFYIKDTVFEDDSNPIHYYNVKTNLDKRLLTNTIKNKYLQIVGNKIVFTSMGKTSDTERYARKAYVGDLVIYP